MVFYDNRRVYSYKKIFGLAVIKNYGCVILTKVRRGSVLNRTDHAKFGIILSISRHFAIHFKTFILRLWWNINIRLCILKIFGLAPKCKQTFPFLIAFSTIAIRAQISWHDLTSETRIIGISKQWFRGEKIQRQMFTQFMYTNAVYNNHY